MSEASERLREWSKLGIGYRRFTGERQADIKAVLDELEAMQRDAGRYRLLRSMHWNQGRLSVTAASNVKLGVDCPTLERLDRALDLMASDTLTPGEVNK